MPYITVRMILSSVHIIDIAITIETSSRAPLNRSKSHRDEMAQDGVSTLTSETALVQTNVSDWNIDCF